MRSTTHVWIGVNNVGMPDDPAAVFSGTFTESILQLSQWLGPRSMASRFDVVIARSEEEARNALRIRGRETTPVSAGVDDLANRLAHMMEQVDDKVD